ncbi:MAG: IS66-like element ISRhru2 family transposase [Sphingomicrobium sp.]
MRRIESVVLIPLAFWGGLRFVGAMAHKGPLDLAGMNRAFFETLDGAGRLELLCRLHAMTVELSERVQRSSANSSRPPSSDGPFKGVPLPGLGQPASEPTPMPGPRASTPSAPRRKAGKQPGAKGIWRCEALTPERTQNHYPERCTGCGAALELWFAQKGQSGHHVLDLERLTSGIRVSCVLHRYHAITCPCGTETAARPGTGEVSTLEGRKRQLCPSEAGLVGPALTTFIAALSVRYRLSRTKIAELLSTWFDVRLSVGSIDRCIREAGLACEPMVEGLLVDLRAADVVNVDETPWPQRGKLRWLWVALSSTTAIYRIAGRHAATIRDLIGEAFLGFLVSDGYAAYRDHPRRQRCLAHLIRKGVALADGFNYDAARFGEWLVREIRGLIHAVSEQAGARIPNPILARLKRACRLNQDAETAKARALAGEVLADWDAITAFVTNQNLPPTNNDAETALRHAVIARRISYGTRTGEGSRAYAAILSIVETCRRRKIDPGAVMERAIASARKGIKLTSLPA